MRHPFGIPPRDGLITPPICQKTEQEAPQPQPVWPHLTTTAMFSFLARINNQEWKKKNNTATNKYQTTGNVIKRQPETLGFAGPFSAAQ